MPLKRAFYISCCCLISFNSITREKLKIKTISISSEIIIGMEIESFHRNTIFGEQQQLQKKQQQLLLPQYQQQQHQQYLIQKYCNKEKSVVFDSSLTGIWRELRVMPTATV